MITLHNKLIRTHLKQKINKIINTNYSVQELTTLNITEKTSDFPSLINKECCN